MAFGGKGSLASAGIVAVGSLGPAEGELKAGMSVGNVEFKDGTINLNSFNYGYKADAKLTKDLDDNHSVEVNNTGELTFGLKVVVALEVMVNPVKVTKAFIHTIGALFEFTRAAANEQVPLSPDKRARFNTTK